MEKMFWYIDQGGPLMYPLLLASVVSFALIIERFVNLKSSKILAIPDRDQLIDLLRGDIDKARNLLDQKKSLLGGILSRSIDQEDSLPKNFEAQVQEVSQRETQALFKNLPALSTIAKLAPLIGLLGTVVGMIGAFEVLSDAGVGKEEMASQIRVALITTATGLMVAIPAALAESYYKSCIKNLVYNMELTLDSLFKGLRAPVVAASDEVSA